MKLNAFPVTLLALLSIGARLCLAQSADESKVRLNELPQPWVKPIHRITFEEYEATLKYWAQQHPGIFSFQKRGESHDGQPVYLVKITDASVPPGKASAADLFVVTCAYKSNEQRSYGWKPPEAVARQLQGR